MQVTLRGYQKRLFEKSGENAVYYDLFDTGQMIYYQTERQQRLTRKNIGITPNA